MKRYFLIITVFFLWLGNLQAILFERRDTTPPSLSYFVLPIAGNIPGVQSFYGVTSGISGINGTGLDVAGFIIQGEANKNFNTHGNGGNFRLNILSVTDIPVIEFFRPGNDLFTFSLYYGAGNNIAFAVRERGIDSDKDNLSYILLNKFGFDGLQISTKFLQNKLEFFYTFANGNAEPLGFITSSDNFIPNDNANVSSRGDGGRYGVILDDTDNRRDPRIGYRLRYERYNFPRTTGESTAYYQQNYNLAGYIPFINKKLVLVVNQFYSASTVTSNGTVDPNNYDCTKLSITDCNQTEQNNRLEKAKEEANLGRATALGGISRLRGYPTGRFYDSYTNFQGAELRWYFLQGERSFDWVVEKGVNTSIQIATFYERGTVARTVNSLWSDFRDSYGLGFRVLFTSLVFRLDLGASEEGRETTFFVGYPF